MAKLTLQQKADKILKEAEKKGLERDFYFTTTFKRYQVQMDVLDKLEKMIEEEGPTVEKEYVKGRKNIYVNPAITEYNKTATAANGTVQTLLKIVQTHNASSEGSENPLAEFLARGKK